MTKNGDKGISATSVAVASLGIAAGAWAWQRIRDFAAADRANSMVDWKRTREIASNMNKSEALTAVERASLDEYYADLVLRAIPIVSEYTGASLEYSSDQVHVFDRVDWINANLDSFQHLFAPLEAFNSTPNPNVLSRAWHGVNQNLMSYQVGLLMGYMARRVMGQYDLTMLGREPVAEAGKLYFVEPNIRGIERKLGLPREDFRMWLALHETTHVFQFEAHPWVRQHFNKLLEQYMGFLQKDSEFLKQGLRGLQMFAQRFRLNASDHDGSGSWMEAIMNAEQRALFNEMQAMMSVIEGYSNHVMNAVGKNLLPSYDLISRKFEERQQMRSQADQLLSRITGLNVKMEQYRIGEEFIDAVVAARDHAFAYKVWDGPENLPTMAELKAPNSWIDRIERSEQITG